MKDFTRTTKQPSDEQIAKYHQYLRKNKKSIVYYIVYFILVPILLARSRSQGVENVPKSGRVIIAANHESFTDPFYIAAAIKRKIFFVAKSELFSNPILGWLFVRLGAIPIKRGQSDVDALETACILLEADQALGIFPEGTRKGPRAKSGVSRLSIDTNSPVIPAAVYGTDKKFNNKIIVSFSEPIKLNDDENEPNKYKENIVNLTNKVWSAISVEKEKISQKRQKRKFIKKSQNI